MGELADDRGFMEVVVNKPADERSLEGQFQLCCAEIVAEVRELGVLPGGWISLINELGAVGGARFLFENQRVLPVSRLLVDHGRPELTIEFQIAQPRWADLFTDEEREEAARRLASLPGWPSGS
jgi:hypothetical protein